jgi:tetrahydromethanopterin S-methyltransferase subunit B
MDREEKAAGIQFLLARARYLDRLGYKKDAMEYIGRAAVYGEQITPGVFENFRLGVLHGLGIVALMVVIVAIVSVVL